VLLGFNQLEAKSKSKVSYKNLKKQELLKRKPANFRNFSSGPIADCLFLKVIYPDLENLQAQCNAHYW